VVAPNRRGAGGNPLTGDDFFGGLEVVGNFQRTKALVTRVPRLSGVRGAAFSAPKTNSKTHYDSFSSHGHWHLGL
jgi:hypothetical protein